MEGDLGDLGENEIAGSVKIKMADGRRGIVHVKLIANLPSCSEVFDESLSINVQLEKTFQ